MILYDRRLAMIEMIMTIPIPMTKMGDTPTFFSAVSPKTDIVTVTSSTTTSSVHKILSTRSDAASLDLSPSPNIDDVVNLICTCTPKVFRTGVWQSGGRFLYRGAEDDDDDPNDKGQTGIGSIRDGHRNSSTTIPILSWIHVPEPDLLVPQTYDFDPTALEYFECLERRTTAAASETTRGNMEGSPVMTNNRIRTVARPSNGHIGTSDAQEAKNWGQDVVSVWPLGDTLSYIWPLDRTTFVPSPKVNSSDNDRRRRSRKGPSCAEDRLVQDSGLEKALTMLREVLFASWFLHTPTVSGSSHSRSSTHPISRDLLRRSSAFLAVPIEYDITLREHLGRVRYGL